VASAKRTTNSTNRKGGPRNGRSKKKNRAKGINLRLVRKKRRVEKNQIVLVLLREKTEKTFCKWMRAKKLRGGGKLERTEKALLSASRRKYVGGGWGGGGHLGATEVDSGEDNTVRLLS